MSTTWFGRGVEKHFLGHRNLQRDRCLVAMLPWLQREYVLIHEEGSSLSDDVALTPVRICLTQEALPRPRDKDNVEAGRVATVGEGANLARRVAATWLTKRPVWHPNSKGKSLQKVDGLIKILYIFEENADEDPKIRVSVKDEGLIGKKMRETMLAKGKPIVLEKVRLYVQSMANGDLEIKRVELKSNQSAPHIVAMAIAPAASKPAVVVEKNNRGFQKPLKRKDQDC